MKRLCLPLLAAALLCGTVSVGAATLSVTGRGEVTAAADTASFSAAVETTAATQEEAAAENAARTRALRTALIAAGAEFDRLSTGNYSMNPVYHYDNKGKRTFLGYRVVNRLEVRVTQLSRVGAVLDAATQNGAGRIDSVAFSCENAAVYQTKAYHTAGADARQKAAAAANALGKNLGRVLSVSEASYAAPRRNFIYAASLKADTAATPIEAGDETLSAELTVTYELL